MYKILSNKQPVMPIIKTLGITTKADVNQLTSEEISTKDNANIDALEL
jgi:hypothetical protein